MKTPASIVVGAVSAFAFLAGFVFLLLFFFPDPQTSIALMYSPVYGAYFGSLVGIIHASVVAIRGRTAATRAIALTALPIAALLLAAFIWWLLSEVGQYYRIAS